MGNNRVRAACAGSAMMLACTAMPDPHTVRGDAQTDSGPFDANMASGAPQFATVAQGVGDTSLATNGVRGFGTRMGSTDVYSMNYTDRTALTFALPCEVADGAGSELVVFENPFVVNDSYSFMDLVIVEVSRDGEHFVALPHAFLGTPGRYSPRPNDWMGFAGVTPVLLNSDAIPATDPFDVAQAGGDAFDWASVDWNAMDSVARDQFYPVRFVRLIPAPVRDDPRNGLPYPKDPASDGPDIDGIVVRCPL